MVKLIVDRFDFATYCFCKKRSIPNDSSSRNFLADILTTTELRVTPLSMTDKFEGQWVRLGSDPAVQILRTSSKADDGGFAGSMFV